MRQAAYGVVFLRGQTLTPDHQLAAARRFGPINVDSSSNNHPQSKLCAITMVGGG